MRKNRKTCQSTDFSEEIISDMDEKKKDHGELNESLISCGLSPLRLHGITAHRKVPTGKRKLKQAKIALRKKVACTLDLEEKALLSENSSSEDDDEIKRKASEFDRLMEMVKEKLPQISHREKIQLLTLIPESWSRKKIIETFSVTEYQVRLLWKLLREKGLLTFPDARIGKRLSEDTIISVTEFYEDDEFSRLMPGQKDKVSIKKKCPRSKKASSLQSKWTLCPISIEISYHS